MSFPIIINLQFPIQFGTDTITDVSISRRIQAGDMLKTEGMGEIKRTLYLVGLLTGLAPAAVELMDYKDLLAVNEVLESFLLHSRKDGSAQQV
jgi:hypothetical protein